MDSGSAPEASGSVQAGLAAGINASGEIFQIASFAPPIFKAALLFRTSSNR